MREHRPGVRPARVTFAIVGLDARAMAACPTKLMRHTPDHVRSDLSRNFGQCAFSGPKPSGPPGGGRGPSHNDRLRGGYAAAIAAERRRLQKTRSALTDARP